MRTGSQARRWKSRLIAAIALVALVLSMYLAWHAFSQNQLLGCNSGNAFSCDEVLGSRWSKVLGIPVAIPGVMIYLLIFATSLLQLRERQPTTTPSFVVPRAATVSWIRLALITLAFAAATSGAWFTILQFVKVGKLCWYCLSVHSCGIAIATLLTLDYRSSAHADFDNSVEGRPTQDCADQSTSLFWQTAMAGFGATALLAILQIMVPTVGHEVTELRSNDLAGVAGFSDVGHTTLATSDSEKRLPTPTNDVPSTAPQSDSASTEADGVDAQNHASDRENETGDAPPSTNQPDAIEKPPTSRFDQAMLVGSRSAGYAIVEVIDYTCDACRQAYPPLERVMERYPDKLAIVVIPIARDFTCNQHLKAGSKRNEKSCKLTRMAIAIWTLNPDSFAEFHHWMLAGEQRSLSDAWAFAGKLVGTSALLSMIDDPTIDQRLAVNNRVWDNTGQVLPTIVVGGKKIQGMVHSDEELEALIESYLPFNQPQASRAPP